MTTTTLIALALAIIATVALIEVLRLRWELRQAVQCESYWQDKATSYAGQLNHCQPRDPKTGRMVKRGAK